MMVTATTFTLFKTNIQRCRGFRPRHLFCGFLCIVLALNRVNVVAVTTILVLPVGVIGHHVRRHYFMFPRRSGNEYAE